MPKNIMTMFAPRIDPLLIASRRSLALDAVLDYLANDELELSPLLRLRDALVSAQASAMLATPPGKGRGRREDRPRKQEVQGVLAGIVAQAPSHVELRVCFMRRPALGIFLSLSFQPNPD
jgi:hypothetical protein